MKIKSVSPGLGVPGGILRVELGDVRDPVGLRVHVGDSPAQLLGASPDALTVKLLSNGDARELVVGNGETASVAFRSGRVLYEDLHCVSNPAVDSMGNVFVTYSGTRGETVPFSVFVISPDGNKQPFLADIVNPTGLTIGPDDSLYISSRHSGTVYRSTFDKQVEKYAEGLGLATGVVFDSQGNLLVGDRSGTIYRIAPDRSLSLFCELEPSVSAYHLAIDGEDNLYVTGPTLATQDCVYRISPEGSREVHFKGLGRPQGIAFDPSGTLQVAASYRGRKGLFSFSGGEPVLKVAGPMLVGFAYSRDGRFLYLVDSTRLFRLELAE